MHLLSRKRLYCRQRTGQQRVSHEGERSVGRNHANATHNEARLTRDQERGHEECDNVVVVVDEVIRSQDRWG